MNCFNLVLSSSVNDVVSAIGFLPFAEETLYNELTKHISNTDIHATLEEKDFWSNKINIVSDVANETLIFTRN